MKLIGEGSIQPMERKERRKCRKWRLYQYCADKPRNPHTKVVRGNYTDAKEAREPPPLIEVGASCFSHHCADTKKII